MPREITYLRKYIILKNDYTNISNLHPKGHGKIEIRGAKGTISLNLENCEAERDYRVYLLRDKEGEVYELDLCRIITDERGITRTDINLNLRDLELGGFSIDKIDAILIRRGMHILLGGYIDNNNGTIERFIKTLILEEDIPVKLDKIEETEEPLVEESLKLSTELPLMDEPQVIIENIEELPAEEITIIEEPAELTDVEELQELPSIDLEATETIKSSSEEMHDNLIEDIEGANEIEPDPSTYQSLEYFRRLNHKNQMTSYILNILSFFPYVQPLKMYIHGYSWWRIENDGTDSYKGFLPYYNYLMSSNYKYPFLNNSTTCLNLIRKYGHYLFGMYKEGKETKYYIYGVPGKFTVEEHPFKGITGFSTWYESFDEIGYWILYIDPMTGKIIYPLNPMVPAY